MQSRKDEKRVAKISTNSFATANLGWINCDRFYNDPNAKEAKILASINNETEYEFAKLSLVINGRRIALNGTPSGDSHYTFTGKSEPYTKLPIGEQATIIGFSYKDGQPYLGMRRIMISEEGNYSIDLMASSEKEITEQLKNIN